MSNDSFSGFVTALEDADVQNLHLAPMTDAELLAANNQARDLEDTLDYAPAWATGVIAGKINDLVKQAATEVMATGEPGGHPLARLPDHCPGGCGWDSPCEWPGCVQSFDEAVAWATRAAEEANGG